MRDLNASYARQQAFGNPCAELIGPRQQDRELLAAVARKHVVATVQRSAQRLRGGSQTLVAEQVAVGTLIVLK